MVAAAGSRDVVFNLKAQIAPETASAFRQMADSGRQAQRDINRSAEQGSKDRQRFVEEEASRAKQLNRQSVREEQQAQQERSRLIQKGMQDRIRAEQEASKALQQAQQERSRLIQKGMQDRIRAEQEASKASQRAMREAERSVESYARASERANERVLMGSSRVLHGILGMARGMALLGIAGEESTRKIMQNFVAIEGIYQIARSGAHILKGLNQMWGAYAAAVAAATAMEAASTAAAKASAAAHLEEAAAVEADADAHMHLAGSAGTSAAASGASSLPMGTRAVGMAGGALKAIGGGSMAVGGGLAAGLAGAAFLGYKSFTDPKGAGHSHWNPWWHIPGIGAKATDEEQERREKQEAERRDYIGHVQTANDRYYRETGSAMRSYRSEQWQHARPSAEQLGKEREAAAAKYHALSGDDTRAWEKASGLPSKTFNKETGTYSDNIRLHQGLQKEAGQDYLQLLNEEKQSVEEMAKKESETAEKKVKSEQEHLQQLQHEVQLHQKATEELMKQARTMLSSMAAGSPQDVRHTIQALQRIDQGKGTRADYNTAIQHAAPERKKELEDQATKKFLTADQRSALGKGLGYQKEIADESGKTMDAATKAIKSAGNIAAYEAAARKTAEEYAKRVGKLVEEITKMNYDILLERLEEAKRDRAAHLAQQHSGKANSQ